MAGLTWREELFAEYLARTGDPETAAEFARVEMIPATVEKLGSRPEIQRLVRNRAEGVPMTKEEVCEALEQIARSSMDFFVSRDGAGGYCLDLEKAERAGKLGLVKAIETDASGNVVRVELHDREEALSDLLILRGLSQGDITPPWETGGRDEG